MARIISPSGKGGSGAPSGVYADIDALGAAYPDGNKNVYVTLDDGNWNYWNGTAWVAGGVYLSDPTVVNSLTDGGVDVPLSAEMGKELDEKKADKFTEGNYTKGNIIIAGEGGIFADSGVGPVWGLAEKTATLSKQLQDYMQVISQADDGTGATAVGVGEVIIPQNAAAAPVIDVIIKGSAESDGNIASSGTGRLRSVSADEAQQSAVYISGVETLRGITGNLCDEIRLSDGRLVTNISGSITLDESLDWSGFHTAYSNVYRVQVTGMAESLGIAYGDLAAGVAKSDDDTFPVTAYANKNEQILALHPSGTLYLCVIRDKIDAMPSGGTMDGFLEYITQYPITAICRLATPVESNIRVAGTLNSYPGGTVSWEQAASGAGPYTSDGIALSDVDHAIYQMDKITATSQATWEIIELDASEAVVAADGLSFTHADLTVGDIVFYEYYYSAQSLDPGIAVSYPKSIAYVEDVLAEVGSLLKSITTEIDAVWEEN